MEYTYLGKTGLKVSKICLGTAFRGQMDDNICLQVVLTALDAGINFIDTANVYGEGRIGQAEKVLSEALKGKREQLVIATKAFYPVGKGPNERGLSRVHLMNEVEKSLKRLKTDYLDIFYFHEFDPNTDLEDALKTADILIKQGKVRYLGFSRFSAWQAEKALRLAEQYGLEKVSVLQNRYNLIYREAELELLPFLRDSSLGMVVFSPLGIGLLSGRFKKGTPPPADTPWGQGYQGIEFLLTTEIDQTIDELRRIAAEKNKTPAQVAINWILDHPEVSSIIIGPDNPEQVMENIQAVNWKLTQEERKKLDDLSAPLWAQRRF